MASGGRLLFDRRCRIAILTPSDAPGNYKDATPFDALEIDAGSTSTPGMVGLRTKFRVKKTLKKEPNTAEIVVTNLSVSHRDQMQKKGVKIVLYAGYSEPGTFRIFSGDIRTVDHVRNGPDWDTTFKAGDGERAWNFARVNSSMAPGTSVADVLKAAVKGMGVGFGNLNKKLSSFAGTYDQGYALHGAASTQLDRIVTANGQTWSIQDNELQILGPGESIDSGVPEISPTTGLVGSPEMGSPSKKKGPTLVKFKCLLTEVKPGEKVKLKSERYPGGFVKIVTCEFVGDTHGGDWYTEISAEVL